MSTNHQPSLSTGTLQQMIQANETHTHTHNLAAAAAVIVVCMFCCPPPLPTSTRFVGQLPASAICCLGRYALTYLLRYLPAFLPLTSRETQRAQLPAAVDVERSALWQQQPAASRAAQRVPYSILTAAE